MTRWNALLKDRTDRIACEGAETAGALRREAALHERVTLLTKLRDGLRWWQRRQRECAEVHLTEALAHFETARAASHVVADRSRQERNELIDDYRAALGALAFIVETPQNLPGESAMELVDLMTEHAQGALREAEARMARFADFSARMLEADDEPSVARPEDTHAP